MVFTTLTLSQMGHALAVRSSRDSLFKIGLLSNKPLLGAVLLTFVLQMAVVYAALFAGDFQDSGLVPRRIGHQPGPEHSGFLGCGNRKVVTAT